MLHVCDGFADAKNIYTNAIPTRSETMATPTARPASAPSDSLRTGGIVDVAVIDVDVILGDGVDVILGDDVDVVPGDGVDVILGDDVDKILGDDGDMILGDDVGVILEDDVAEYTELLMELIEFMFTVDLMVIVTCRWFADGKEESSDCGI